jgi:hypothetical protein
MGSTTSYTSVQCWIGTAVGNNTTGRDLERGTATISVAATIPGGIDVIIVTPMKRFNITSTTTYYCKALANFTSTAPVCGGGITARRVA